MPQNPAKKWSVILDGDYKNCQPGGHSTKFFWSEFDVPKGAVSIPLLVDKKSNVLRKEYLALIHDISETRINRKNIREHLKISKDFSFWWLTMLAQKSPLKVKSINIVFKLRVFEKQYLADGYDGLVLFSDNVLLHNVLSHWCRKLGHAYRWKGERRRNFRFNLRSLYKTFPLTLRAFGGLLLRWTKRNRFVSPVKQVEKTEDQVTIVTYVPNMDETRAEQGVFYSRYWEDLHDLLEEKPYRVNWIWMFIDDGGCTFKRAVQYRNKFQKKAGSAKRFYFLEEFTDSASIFKAIWLYVRLYFKARNLESVRESFHFTGSKMQLWQVMSAEWYNSLYGPAAMEECLMATVFEKLAGTLPPQQWCLYLYENHPWEHALVHAWKQYQTGRIIGYQHSSLRFMLMNYYEDSRTYGLTDYSVVMPDIVAINGRGAQKLLNEAGFPKDKIVLVEAVRYMYLRKSLTSRKSVSSTDKKKVFLVLTGIEKDEVRQQFLLLAGAAKSGGLDQFDEVIVKPHPYTSIDSIFAETCPQDRVRLVNLPLSELLPKVDIVYAANNTSTSLEAALVGVPVIVNLVDSYLNHSVLQGYEGVSHVGSVEALCSALDQRSSPLLPDDYFCLNEGLSRWRELLI